MSSRTRVIAGVVVAVIVAIGISVVVMSGMDHGSDNDDASGRDIDAAFITGMVPHHESAVEMAEIAVKKAQHPEIKELAQNIISTQNDEIDTLKAAHERIFDEVLPANGMQHGDLGLSEEEMGMHGDMSMLEDAKGDDFDREFIDMMIPHHQGAIRMAYVEQEKGEDSEMKTLAGDIVTAQSTEIKQMNEWRENWYGEASPAGGVPKPGESSDSSEHESMEGMDH